VPNPDTLLDSLERFASVLTSGYGVGDVLHDLSEETTDVLSLTGAGVTLVHDGKQRFVTAAIEAIASLERVQENHQAGPCIDAVASAQPTTVSDLDNAEASQRWPEYTHAAKIAGIRAVAGVPMLADRSAVGAVKLYLLQSAPELVPRGRAGRLDLRQHRHCLSAARIGGTAAPAHRRTTATSTDHPTHH
jgi:hypothetical protein